MRRHMWSEPGDDMAQAMTTTANKPAWIDLAGSHAEASRRSAQDGVAEGSTALTAGEAVPTRASPHGGREAPLAAVAGRRPGGASAARDRDSILAVTCSASRPTPPISAEAAE